MDILQDFDDLRHNDDLFNNLFKNVWDFNDLFKRSSDRNNLVFVSIDSLNLNVNLVSNIGLSDKFFLFNYSIVVCNDLFNLSIFMFNSDNFLFNDFNFLDFVVDQWNFNRSVSVDFNEFVNFN